MYQFKLCDDWLVISKVHTLTMTDTASVFMFIQMVWIFKHIRFTEHRGTVPTLSYTCYALPILSSGAGTQVTKACPANGSQLPLESTQVCEWTSAGITALWVVQMHIPKSSFSCHFTFTTWNYFLSSYLVNHIFWPEQLFEWSPNNIIFLFYLAFSLHFFFLTFCYFFSFVVLHHPSHHEVHPILPYQ